MNGFSLWPDVCSNCTVNKTGRHNSQVTNPGPSGVFLFPNALTLNVGAFPPLPLSLRRPTSVGHVFPFPRSRPAVESLPDPFPARPIHARRIQDVECPSCDGRSDPFPDVLRRPTNRNGRSPTPSRSDGRPDPFLTVDPDGRPLGKPRPDCGRSCPGSCPTTSTPVGRRLRRKERGFTEHR